MSYPAEYWPSFYPTITSQWFYYNGQWAQSLSCVANSLAYIKEIQEYRERGVREQYSHLWIYGNRYSYHSQGEGMMYLEAFNKLVDDGVPPYHDFPNQSQSEYNSHYNYRAWSGYLSAKESVQAQYGNLITKAQYQRINSYSNWFNTYDTDLMKNYITNYGYVLFPVKHNTGMRDNTGSNGIVPNSGTSLGTGHAVVALGWRIINSQLHWICANTWGTWYGDNGICYVPSNYIHAYSSCVLYDAPYKPKLDSPTYSSAYVTHNSIRLYIGQYYIDGVTDPKPNIWHIRCRLGQDGSGAIVEDKYVTNINDILFQNLESDTFYNFVARAERTGGAYDPSDYTPRVVLKTNVSLTPSTPSHPPYGQKVEGGFDLYWGASTGATLYRLRVRRGYDDNTFTVTTTGTTYIVTGLQKGVTYYLSVRGENQYGNSAYTTESTATTAPHTPTISNSAVTDTSISISIGSMTGNWDHVRVYRYTSGGSLIDYRDIPNGSTITAWSGLPTGTTYKFNAKSRFYINDVWLESVDFSNELTITTSVRPNNWEWITTELNAFNNNGAITALTWTRWNDFIDRINEFRVYKGLGTIGGKMSSSDKVLTATRFNTVRQTIGEMYATGITNRVPGDLVLGNYFIILKNSLNSIS